MKFFFGLGNPIDKYKKTRHNLGAIIVEQLVGQYGSSFVIDKKIQGYRSIIPKQSTFGNPVAIHCVISKNLYMNLSGSLVGFYKKKHKLENKDIVVFHDEVELPVHEVSYKFYGGLRGHNGLRDIVKKLGGNEFHRISLGIGRPASKEEGLYDYVLSPIHKEDIPSLEIIEKVIKENVYKENPEQSKTKRYK